MRSAQKILIRTSERKRPYGMPGHKWEDTVKLMLEDADRFM
jgi:hypothetical protein